MLEVSLYFIIGVWYSTQSPFRVKSRHGARNGFIELSLELNGGGALWGAAAANKKAFFSA